MRSRAVWLAATAAAVAVIAIAWGGWRVASDVIPSVLDARDSFSQFRQASLGRIMSDESAGLEELRADAELIESDLRGAGRFMRWVRRVSPAFSWVPLAGRETDAWGSQMGRAINDLDAALILLDSASGLLDVYTDSQGAILDAGDGASIPPLKARVQVLRENFASGRDETDEARRMGRVFGVGSRAPQVQELADVLRELEGRAGEAAQVGQEVSGLLLTLLDLADSAQPLLDQFSADGAGERWSVETFRGTLERLARHTSVAREGVGTVTALLAKSEEAEWLLPRLAALDDLLGVMGTLNEASATGLDTVEQTFELMTTSGGGLFNSDGGLGDVFGPFLERRDEIEVAIAGLEEARQTLSALAVGVDTGLDHASLARVSAVVTDLHSGLRLANSIAPVGRSMLGSHGVRRYLVMGQSADELRATGGFVSSVWVVTFENGGLADIRYQDTVRVDDWGRLELYPKAPPGLDEHMNAWVWLFRDVSWDPDFPTTARTAEDIYRLGQRQDVDGVIAINQWTLLRLIEVLGDISSPEGDEPVTPRNLLEVLEEGTDRHGRAYMDLVLQGLLDRLNQPMSMPELVRLAAGLFETLDQREMLLHFNDSDVQSVVRQWGWDGAVPQETVDYLYVVDSNVGWSKSDRNVQRDVSYAVDLVRAAGPRVTLTLSYSNRSGPGSPGCEPQWLNRGSDYSQLKNACYWNYFRVYAPQGARLLSSTPLPLPEHTVSVEIGRGTPGHDTNRVSSSHNKTVFSGLTSIEAGARQEIGLVYDLPSSVVRRDGDTITYRLLVQKQPGVRQRGISVAVTPPEGYQVTASSLPFKLTGGAASFDFVLGRDTVLEVEFKKGN